MDISKRLNKYISDSGFSSRREADEFIENGLVKVNGKVAHTGTMIGTNDKVIVNGHLIDTKTQKIYIVFNKPIGITCTTDKKDSTNIIDYIRYPIRIFPIGRIDKDSEGLVLLTSDGDIVNRILRAGNAHEKEYHVTVDKKITEQFVKKMAAGVRIHKTITLPCKVTRLKGNGFSIVLKQGLNRQIRLMCETLGYEVLALRRTRIMDIDLKGVEVGTYRELTSTEINNILNATKDSSKTEEASKIRKGKQQSKKNPSVRYASNNKKSGKYSKKKSPIRNKMKSKRK